MKCEELEDMAKQKIEEAKSEGELQTLLTLLRTEEYVCVDVRAYLKNNLKSNGQC